jgi:hypothetical protein
MKPSSITRASGWGMYSGALIGSVVPHDRERGPAVLQDLEPDLEGRETANPGSGFGAAH